MSKRGPGPLVIIGGAEDKTGDQIILREFVRLAGGERAHIAIMTVATRLPQEVGARYVEVFRGLGVADAEPVGVTTRSEANDAQVVAAVERASGIFFSGGDQLRVVTLLGGSETERCLHRRHGEGVVLGGTSAGASVMSNIMIIEGRSEEHPSLRIIEK